MVSSFHASLNILSKNAVLWEAAHAYSCTAKF